MLKPPDAFLKDIKVAVFFLSLAHQLKKSYITLTIVSSLFSAMTPFVNIIMTKYIIDELLSEQRMDMFAILIGVTVSGNAIIGVLNRYFDNKAGLANFDLMNGIELHLGKQMMNMDYESLEDAKVLDLKEQALAPIRQQGAIAKMIANIRAMVQSIISIAGLVAIISTLNVFLLLVICAFVWINTFIYKKSQQAQFNYHKMLTPINRKFGYYSKLSTDFSMAKDVRIYNMAPFILKKVADYHKESVSGFGKLFGIVGVYQGVSNINIQLQMLVVYVYMVFKVYIGAIGIGSFTMFVAAVNSFSNHMETLLKSFVEFRQMCKYLDFFMRFERLPAKMRTGGLKVAKANEVVIEFKHVYFRYPGSEKDTLKDVSITIAPGEKLAIVGENGAGKSTFIKLLCRLYDPSQGEILLNGININSIEYSEYMKQLSVIFQDYKLFHFSIKENIMFDEAYRSSASDKAIWALEQAGLLPKVASLNKGIDTSIYKVFDRAGIELSGGESQKLAMARAIYKSAPIMILDEPTAALDPYAEYEVYSRFNEIIDNKTAIYISHRLSSCKFCEKIAVFENGEIIEYGNHSELLQRRNKYYKMWEAQATYYNERNDIA